MKHDTYIDTQNGNCGDASALRFVDPADVGVDPLQFHEAPRATRVEAALRFGVSVAESAPTRTGAVSLAKPPLAATAPPIQPVTSWSSGAATNVGYLVVWTTAREPTSVKFHRTWGDGIAQLLSYLDSADTEDVLVGVEELKLLAIDAHGNVFDLVSARVDDGETGVAVRGMDPHGDAYEYLPDIEIEVDLTYRVSVSVARAALGAFDPDNPPTHTERLPQRFADLVRTAAGEVDGRDYANAEITLLRLPDGTEITPA